MNWMYWSVFFASTLCDPSIQAKFASLQPESAAQHFAFYELYPNTKEGKKALEKGWMLLAQKPLPTSISYNPSTFFHLIRAINREEGAKVLFSEKELCWIEEMGKTLKNRSLPGYKAWSTKEVLQLDPEEIDLARAIFLEEYEDQNTIRSYEAFIDLMALQVVARLSLSPSPEEIIYTINQLIFHEMGFRFPPASAWKDAIDAYTVLPSVIDAKRGVCLGVSILYLALAQRIGLPLEAITPPGHIYVRYAENDQIINIETTARGIDISSEHYLGLELTELPKKTIKEVIGLVFVNQASVKWSKKQYQKAICLYEKALVYLPSDPLVLELLGYNHVFSGNAEKGKKLLQLAIQNGKSRSTSAKSVSEDFLLGKVSIEGIEAVFHQSDETKESIEKTQETLRKILADYPEFRAGLLQYALTFLQLGKEKKALFPLEKLHQIDPKHIATCYYLAMIYINRYDYKKAWFVAKKLQSYIKNQKRPPKILKDFLRELEKICPDPG